MLDTMTATKIVGAVCAALLVLLLGQWLAHSIYQVNKSEHGKEPHSIIFADLETNVVAAIDVAPVVDIAELLATADPAKGKKVFAKCKACHKANEEVNGVGPHLVAIINRAVGEVADFRYSNPMAELGGVWNVEELSAFILNPKSYLPGTKMSFAGLKKDTDRAHLIAYLQSLQD